MKFQKSCRKRHVCLNRGSRRKPQTREFGLWWCSIKAFSKEGHSAVAHLNDWADLVFGSGLEYGGLTSHHWMDVQVSGRGDKAKVQAKVRALERWLSERFRKVEMSPLLGLNDASEPNA
ncbi:MAG: hypothetical protein KF892_09875 [Rhizobacter sp.]|nr:hypothetical protein [Rhizobacter sp.]